MDIIVKCTKCNNEYKFKDTGTAMDKSFFSNKINLSPKINCKCGNIYAWNKAEHKFQWKVAATTSS